MSESGAAFSEMGGARMQIDDAPGRAEAVDLGNNIMTLTPEEVDLWREAAAGIEAKWIEDMNGQGFDGAALVEDAKALIAKYSQ